MAGGVLKRNGRLIIYISTRTILTTPISPCFLYPPAHPPTSTTQLSDTLDRQLSLQYTGNPLSSAGDVNGDGYGDILVGSPTGGAVSQGHTYLVFGGAGLPGRVNLTESDEVSGGNEGVVVFKGALTGEFVVVGVIHDLRSIGLPRKSFEMVPMQLSCRLDPSNFANFS